MYLLLSSVHCPNGTQKFSLISSHNGLIDFFYVLHAVLVVCCLLVELKSCNILKVVSVSAAYFLKLVHWWLHMLLIKKMPLDMR